MFSTTITKVTARQVFSGKGHPAVEATVYTENGASGTVQCTAGLSVGTHEVAFAYDGGSAWRGKGVMRAVENIEKIIGPAIIGMDATKQFEVDNIILNLGGPDAKLRLGGNAIAPVSAAVLKAGAESLGIPLYRHIGGARAVTLPCAAYGCISGGYRYSSGEKSGSKPTYSFIAYDFSKFSEASYALFEVVSSWEELMVRKWGLRPQESTPHYSCSGFFSIPRGLIESDEYLWDSLTETICKKGYEGKIGLQADFAADCYLSPDKKTYQGLFNKETRTREQQIEMILYLAREYPFVIMEDPLSEDDFEGHAYLTEKTGIQIVGDDLFSTNFERVKKGIKTGACNTVLLKVNQVGSITESLEMVQLAYENGYGVMPCSSRGENLDICDYSVGLNATTIRESSLGSAGTRFLEIEAELGSRAKYAGKSGLKGKKFQC
ncbi:MAG: enolase C-terminal domain-like protein [Acetivibrionales bacterium]|jgi:enolase